MGGTREPVPARLGDLQVTRPVDGRHGVERGDDLGRVRPRDPRATEHHRHDGQQRSSDAGGPHGQTLPRAALEPSRHTTISEFATNQFHALAASVSWAEATTPVPNELHHTFVTSGVPVRTQARSPFVWPR